MDVDVDIQEEDLMTKSVIAVNLIDCELEIQGAWKGCDAMII